MILAAEAEHFSQGRLYVHGLLADLDIRLSAETCHLHIGSAEGRDGESVFLGIHHSDKVDVWDTADVCGSAGVVVSAEIRGDGITVVLEELAEPRRVPKSEPSPFR